MDGDKNQHVSEDLDRTADQLNDTNEYIQELHLHHCIDALILSGLVALVLQAFSYLTFKSVITDLDATIYMFCLLIGPAALFLLLLHLYELYGVVTRGKKSIPLTLDLMYFLYFALAFTTMIGLHAIYRAFDVSQKVLTPGWALAVVLLCLEVLAALLLSKYFVTMFFCKKLPHFFEHPKQTRKLKPQSVSRHIIRPHQVYYFRKKPDVSVWQNEEFFVRYKP